MKRRRRSALKGERPKPGTGGAAWPFFSPDGQWIGFFAARWMKRFRFGDRSPLQPITSYLTGVSRFLYPAQRAHMIPVDNSPPVQQPVLGLKGVLASYRQPVMLGGTKAATLAECTRSSGPGWGTLADFPLLISLELLDHRIDQCTSCRPPAQSRTLHLWFSETRSTSAPLQDHPVFGSNTPGLRGC
jgi:hypothetical protein